MQIQMTVMSLQKCTSLHASLWAPGGLSSGCSFWPAVAEGLAGPSAEANTVQSSGNSSAGGAAHPCMVPTTHRDHCHPSSRFSLSVAQWVLQGYITACWWGWSIDLSWPMRVCQVTAICDALRICPNPRAGIPVLLQLKESTELSAAVKRWCICAKILHYINAYI